MIWFISFFPSVGSVSVELEDMGHISLGHDAPRQERSFCVAILTEMGDIDEIRKIFKREMQIQGNEKETLCYFKVTSKVKVCMTIQYILNVHI